MKSRSLIKRSWAGVVAALGLPVKSALACAMCYGASDSPLADGMNWGIITLLLVVVFVLGSIGAFAIYLAKRSAAVESETKDAALPEAPQKA